MTQPGPKITPRKRDLCPLSFAQQRLWFLEQLLPNTGVYNVTEAYRLKGRLDVDALERSFRELILRHELLRTSFQRIEDQVLQVISAEGEFRIERINLQEMPEEIQQQRVREITEQESEEPFDLRRSPLLRVKLLHLKKEEHILLLSIHHIITDGWSMGVFYRELSTLYNAFAAGQPSALAPLSIQYADFTLWQRERMQGELLEKELSYWRNQLKGLPPILKLPTDRIRPVEQSYAGETIYMSLPDSLFQELTKFSREHKVTLFMTLLAVFQTLLYRYTAQDDIVVGTAIAGRNHTQLQGLVGLLINTLALRIDLSGNPTFLETLSRVRKMCIEAYTHQELPFEKLVEELRPHRSLNTSPLFQIMLSFDPFALEESLLFEQIKVGKIPLNSRTAKFDLALEIIPGSVEEMDFRLEYKRDLFTRERMRRLLSHFSNLLQNTISDPEKHISEYPLLTDKEYQQIVYEWNHTERDYPREKCIHQLFEEIAGKNPDLPAVKFGERTLTYSQLNSQANQLANYLRALGVEERKIVAVCMHRSIELIVAFLAILKTGSAYLPLDAADPKERLKSILSDSGSTVILTQQSTERHIPTNFQTVLIDSDSDGISSHDGRNLFTSISSEDLAYVIYTSGSTGQPKGVCIPHRGVSRLLINTNYINFTSSDRVAQIANCTFDASTFEIWGALLHGACLVGITKDIVLSPKDFAFQIRDQKITILWLTASLFHLIAEEKPDSFQSVDALLVGGEVVDPKSIRKVLESRPPGHIINGYGPTESTTFATCYPVSRVSSDAISVPIGRPISNTKIFILDENLQPVPIGIWGEIHIGGDGLATGYLNNPELTSQKFIPDLFSLTAGKRLYKTGDWGRFLEDGNIEFLGRKDDQVKIRGFRIELGEIEATLLRHPSVKTCAVLLREDVPGKKRLVAYWAANEQNNGADTDLRKYLKNQFPEYMLPSDFICLKNFPLTSSGKIDRMMLPSPENGKQIENVNSQPPDPFELQLMKIWENVLGRSIRLDDDFFDLGGNSLLATQLFAEIGKTTGKDLPLALLFQFPTVRQLAELLRGEAYSASSSPLVAIKNFGSKPPFFCIPGGAGSVIQLNLLAKLLGNDQPFYGLQPRGLDGKEQPHETVEEMADFYLTEMRSIQPHGPYYIGGGSLGGLVAYEMSCRLQDSKEKVALLALFDTPVPNHPFPLPSENRRLTEIPFFHARVIFALDWRQKCQYIFESARRLIQRLQQNNSGKKQFQVSPALRNVEEIHYQAVGKYVPRKSSIPITLFQHHWPGEQFDDDKYGWEEITSGGVQVHVVPGSHAIWSIRGSAWVLAKKLRACLIETREKSALESNR